MEARTFEKQLTAKLNFLLYLPNDVYRRADNDAGDTLVPLLLYLHGGGESGQDLELLKTCGLPRLLEQGTTLPFIALMPQNPDPDQFFPEEALFALLEAVIASYPVDNKRIYLTGFSRGGFAAWRMAMQRPDLFAALVPVAAGGLATYAFRAREVPVWAFYGALDETISPTFSAEMVDALQAAGGNVKFTVFPEADHAETLEQTYRHPTLYKWLLEQAKD